MNTCNTEVWSSVYILFNKFIYCKIKLIFRTAHIMLTSQFCIIDNSLSRRAALQFRCLRPAFHCSASSAVRTLILLSLVLFSSDSTTLRAPYLYPNTPQGLIRKFRVYVWHVLRLSSQMSCLHVNATCVGSHLSWMPGYPLTNGGSKLHVNWEYVSRFIINHRVHMPSTSWLLMWMPC